MLGLLASVPTIQEEAEPPMTDESQTSSGPGRKKQRTKIYFLPKRMFTNKLYAICSLLFSVFLDSPQRVPANTEGAGCYEAPDSSTVCPSSTSAPHPDQEHQAPCISSGCHTDPSHPPSLSSTQGHSPLLKSKPSSPSSSSSSQSSSLGTKRKGLSRKVRRGQRQRGRQYCTLTAREEAGEEETMEEDMEQDEERMEEEEETCAETAGQLE